MDDQSSSVLVEFLDSETKFHYLNYYYQKMLIETDDDIYAYTLDVLYEWRWQGDGFIPDDYHGEEDFIPEDYDELEYDA